MWVQIVKPKRPSCNEALPWNSSDCFLIWLIDVRDCNSTQKFIKYHNKSRMGVIPNEEQNYSIEFQIQALPQLSRVIIHMVRHGSIPHSQEPSESIIACIKKKKKNYFQTKNSPRLIWVFLHCWYRELEKQYWYPISKIFICLVHYQVDTDKPNHAFSVLWVNKT